MTDLMLCVREVDKVSDMSVYWK